MSLKRDHLSSPVDHTRRYRSGVPATFHVTRTKMLKAKETLAVLREASKQAGRQAYIAVSCGS